MTKKQYNTLGQLSKSERLTLSITTTINGLFVITVATISSGLLFYTIPHLIVATTASVYLTGKGKSETWKRLVILSSILAAVAAVWLTAAFLPWYMTFLGIR